jgi:uncharacterized membrane protein YphA (DoxX/SURF4 family)
VAALGRHVSGGWRCLRGALLPSARLLMSSLFVWDGIVQLRNTGGTAQYFASVHIPAPDIAVWISNTGASARQLGAERGFL